jgi:hypothetical protein
MISGLAFIIGVLVALGLGLGVALSARGGEPHA